MFPSELLEQNKELFEALNELYHSCPCDSDINQRFQDANMVVFDLLNRLKILQTEQ